MIGDGDRRLGDKATLTEDSRLAQHPTTQGLSAEDRNRDRTFWAELLT